LASLLGYLQEVGAEGISTYLAEVSTYMIKIIIKIELKY
jgi:hypothetical protein